MTDDDRRRAASAAATAGQSAAVQQSAAAPLPATRRRAGLPAHPAHASAAAAPRSGTAAAGRPPGTVRRRGGVAVVGHGVRDAGQPDHRVHPHRAAGRDPRRGAVVGVLGGQPAAQPDRRAGAGGDVHRDLRAGAGAGRARRPRRRHRVRAAARHAGHRAAAGRHRAVGGRRSPAGAADAGQRPAGQPIADDRLRLSAAAAGVVLRPVVGVHGDPQHPQRVRPAGVGAGRQQRRRDRDARPVRPCAGRTFGRPRRDGQRQAAGARHRHDARRVRPDRGASGRHPPGADQPAPAVGHRRPAQEVRHDGGGHGAVRADQPDRLDRRQPDRQ